MKWNIDPEIFHIGPFALRYYSLMFLLGFVSMQAYVKSIFKKEGKNPEDVSSLTTYIIVGMLIGARLGHCLFYDPAYYFSNPLTILYVWEGGLASHGGYLGVIIATYLFLKKHPQYSFFSLMDCIAGPCLFVGGLIRLGNFFNSEIYGAPTTLPWGIVFERVDALPRHPSQLYESLGYFLIAGILAYLYKTKKNLRPGAVLSVAICLSFLFRFFMEFSKEEQSTIQGIALFNMGQWLSLFFVAGGIMLFTLLQRKETLR